MDKIIEVIAYGRNSDKAQTTNQDIQDDAFTHFAANGFATLFGGKAKIVENYKDHGKSASKKRQLHKRHDFHRMLDDVRAGTIRGSDRPFPKIILVLNTSRFSRLHELDTLALYNVLRENDVKLVSIDDRKVYDFDGFAQIIDLLVKAKEDKEYSRKSAQNVLRGHGWRTRLGRCHQRFSPYGMLKLVVTDTKEEMLIARQRSFNKPKDWQSYLIPGDPLEQDVVRAIFQLFKERDVSYTEMGRLFSSHANLKYRLGPTVTELVTVAYEERSLPSGELDPARLAVLADALEDAGCDTADILNHLREPRLHYRGCWPLDLLLGKE